MDDPRIVILTQGKDDPNFNEHAFLSTYLGYTLVQSADLTVRNGDIIVANFNGCFVCKLIDKQQNFEL